MTTRQYRSWVVRRDETPPPGVRMWLADIIELHWRRAMILTWVADNTCVRCGLPADDAHRKSHRLRRLYFKAYEAIFTRPWHWLAAD